MNDEIYNQAISMLKKGKSKQEILLKFSEHKNELSPLLEISSSLFAMPKNIVPTPMMRRKYAAAKAKTFWLAWLHVSKFAAVSVSVMLLISAFGVTGYEASKSTPGNALFTLKQGEENLRLVLASSQNQKASLQVAMAQQRLSEAQQVFSDPTSDQQEKTAALTALSAQTTTAVAQVNTVAVADPKSDINHPLLNSLENITNQQQALLNQIKPSDQVKPAANDALVALNDNTAKISQIKQSIAVASSDQGALADLSASSSAVTVFGTISSVSSATITVEKITFNIGSQTAITNDDGKTLLITDLKPDEKVNVVGAKNDQSLVAQTILLTEQQPAVDTGIKTAATATSATSSLATIKKPTDASTSTSSVSNTNTSTPTTDPNTATGLFMFEDPSPQMGK